MSRGLTVKLVVPRQAVELSKKMGVSSIFHEYDGKTEDMVSLGELKVLYSNLAGILDEINRKFEGLRKEKEKTIMALFTFGAPTETILSSLEFMATAVAPLEKKKALINCMINWVQNIIDEKIQKS